MQKRLRRLRLVLLLLLGTVVIPYGFSRLASSFRCVSLHSASTPSAKKPTRDNIRIACYNIAHGRGVASSNREGGSSEQRQARLNEIASLLRSIDADIVVLNEVDFDSSWSNSLNQARYLAERGGYSHWAEQRNLDFRVLWWKWRFGNAILSKFPIDEATLVDLPEFSGLETLVAGKKKGVDCTINVDGERIRVIGVHLSHRSEAIRAQSARRLNQMVSSDSTPIVIAGDLNSTPTGFPYSQADAVFGNAVDLLDASTLFHRRPAQPPSDSSGLTFHSEKPRSVIDWILVTKSWQFTDYRVEASALSDHRPITADLMLMSAVPP